MRPFKIGVMTDCFRLEPFDALKKAAEIGVDGVQMGTVSGPLSPDNLSAADRTDLKRLCRDLGLTISALCGDMGGGFRDPAENAGKIAFSKRVVDLAVDLECPVVTTHVGVVPEDPGERHYRVLLTACRDIAHYAEQVGVTFAVETGPEPAVTLKRFLDDVDSPALGVNLDPANLVMVVADDPVAAVATFGDRIVHTHAKDGRQTAPCDPVAVYHGTLAPELAMNFEELPLGKGDVDWEAYLDALEKVGYQGFLTIEREVGDDPLGDIRHAVAFLQEKLG